VSEPIEDNTEALNNLTDQVVQHTDPGMAENTDAMRELGEQFAAVSGSGLRENTEAISKLAANVISLRRLFEDERAERERGFAQERRSRRQSIVALALAVVLAAVVGGSFIWDANQRERGEERAEVRAERARCESTNTARNGTREGFTVLIDELFALATANPAPGDTPRPPEQLEALRAQLKEDVISGLEETQPIIDCG
jgi:hypothetical protein